MEGVAAVCRQDGESEEPSAPFRGVALGAMLGLGVWGVLAVIAYLVVA